MLAPPERVTVLTVLTRVPEELYDEFDEPVYSDEQQSRRWDAAIGDAHARLERAAAVFVAAVQVTKRVEAGDVAPTIIAVARDVGADVIVVGERMHTKLRHLARRSIAAKLVHDAQCAVLVVPEPSVT
jgi:nucleotide-binding universal stress UspA family protein